MKFESSSALYNGKKYSVQYYLCNVDDYGVVQNYFNLSARAILKLGIVDDIDQWYNEGEITLISSFDIMDKVGDAAYQTAKTLELANAESLKVNRFQFLNNGRDVFRMYLIPVDDRGAFQYDPKVWAMCYEFGIYNIEDIMAGEGYGNTTSQYVKAKRLMLREWSYHQMQFKNILYTSAECPEAVEDTRYSSKDETGKLMKSAAFTGDILKDLITRFPINSIELGPVNGSMVDVTRWDKGASQIFYTTNIDTDRAEAMDDVFRRHVSEKAMNGMSDRCIFSLERDKPQTHPLGYFTLRSAQDFFNDAATKLYKEVFFLSNNPTKIGDSKTPFISPTPPLADGTITNPVASVITQYEFVDIAPFINTELCGPRIVHSFDFRDRKLRVEYENNTPDTVSAFVVDNYLKKLKTIGAGKGEDLLLVNTPKTLKENHTTSLQMGDSPSCRAPEGYLTLLKNTIFQNTCIRFIVPGMTCRATGTFFTIDPVNKYPDTDFYNKFFGQWFILRLSHFFEQDKYYNEILAVRIHKLKA